MHWRANGEQANGHWAMDICNGALNFWSNAVVTPERRTNVLRLEKCTVSLDAWLW
jgi:hypothetical protein